MTDIIKEILKNLPEEKISDAVFEGANIVLYTKDKKFFMEESGLIKSIVNIIKKRIELRPDPKICLDPEKAEIAIREIMGSEVSVDNIIFDPQRSMVILEVDKPGLASKVLAQDRSAYLQWLVEVEKRRMGASDGFGCWKAGRSLMLPIADPRIQDLIGLWNGCVK